MLRLVVLSLLLGLVLLFTQGRERDEKPLLVPVPALKTYDPAPAQTPEPAPRKLKPSEM
jgi:hypothetical protein